MASRKLKFALFGNIYQSRKSACIHELMSCLAAHGAEVCFEKLFYEYLVSSGKVKEGGAEVFADGDFTADFVISMGGDGTLLRAASHVGGKGIPVIGVNMGRLGFLADVGPGDIEACIEALHRGEYAIEDRGALLVEPQGGSLAGPACALNDVAILKRDDASMITIHASIDGESLATYQADGLIVCTPTGSTAYSLSNGGPIIVPGTPVFGITAVAPHSLNTRPMVISDRSVLTLRVESRSHNFLIAVDGRSEKCGDGVAIRLRKAPYKVRIVKRPGTSYYDTLREKMMWGADGREK